MRASLRAKHRVSRSLRSHKPSSSEQTDTRATSRTRSGADSSEPLRLRFVRTQSLHRLPGLAGQAVEIHSVSSSPGTDKDVGAPPSSVELRKDLPPTNLSQPTLQEVSIDHATPVLRHNEPEPRTRTWRASDEHFEVRRPGALPLLQQASDVRAPCDAGGRRQTLRPLPIPTDYFPPI